MRLLIKVEFVDSTFDSAAKHAKIFWIFVCALRAKGFSSFLKQCAMTVEKTPKWSELVPPDSLVDDSCKPQSLNSWQFSCWR